MAIGNLYIVKYAPDGDGAPYFFDSQWEPELPDFHFPTGIFPSPELQKSYMIRTRLPRIGADFLPDHYLASKDFLKLCKDKSVNFLSAPVEIALQENIINSYYFFLPIDRFNIVDEERSSYVLDKDKHTGLPLMYQEQNSEFPAYEKIENLEIKEGLNCHLFFAREIKELVCTSLFINEYIKRNLSGLSFDIIDDSYKYDSWADF